MAAAKAMTSGNWQEATKYITAIKTWDLFKHGTISVEKIKEMLTTAIQEETLRTYIFNHAPHYDSFSIENLASMFSLPSPKVKNLIAKMIYQEQLVASLDAAEEFVILDHSSTGTNITRMEYLAGFFADKIAVFADANDKLVEAKNVATGNTDPTRRTGPGRKEKKVN
ncbi:Translation initiation factor 3 subunit c [Kappamyces sp. JEL0680]|nr:Translation initiation factor 3 subunit c [Kappamyces sp. JEL0680]